MHRAPGGNRWTYWCESPLRTFMLRREKRTSTITILLWRDRCYHPFALLQWRLLKLGILSQLLQNVFHNASAFIDVSHFTTTKNHRHLHFIFVLQETDRLTDFCLNIMLTCLRSQAYLFCLRLMRALPRFLALFVFVFAEVHNATYRRFFVRCYFHQI